MADSDESTEGLCVCVCLGWKEREGIEGGKERGWVSGKAGCERGDPSVAERERRKGKRDGE